MNQIKSVPEHTFIIPAYGDSPYLEECISSLKNQTVPSEILITTSTPSAFIRDIANKYRIPIYVNDTGGIANDWNFAFTKCKTKYITLAHQDDLYLSRYTETSLNTINKKKNRDFLILFTDYSEIKGGLLQNISPNIVIKQILLSIFIIYGRLRNKRLKKIILSLGNPIACPSVMYNLENLEHFEFSTEFRYNLDWEAWLRMSNLNGSFLYVNKRLLIHRLHEGSQTSIQILDKNRKAEEERIFRLIWNKNIAKFIMKFYKYSSFANVNDSFNHDNAYRA